MSLITRHYFSGTYGQSTKTFVGLPSSRAGELAMLNHACKIICGGLIYKNFYDKIAQSIYPF
jgi:hypothetical protein